MPDSVTIDGQKRQIQPGESVLDAAGRLGIAIPTLCHMNGAEHYTSCMLCVVKERTSGRLIPACSAPAAGSMDIETNTPEVREARRAALELLLSEHVGDCEAPCRRGCPARMNIPLMMRQIAGKRFHDAIVTVKQHIPLPAVLGRICPAPCEKACRRGLHDHALSICLLKRFVADTDLASLLPHAPDRAAMTQKNVAIVGSGPTGLSAAYYLLLAGHACTLFDDHDEPGGMLRFGVTAENLPRNVLDAEIAVIRKLGAVFQTKTRVGKDIAMAQLKRHFDAIVIAVGKTDVNAGTLFGVELTDRGIKYDQKTFQTSVEAIFAGGDAVQPSRMAVRSVAHGRAIAASVDRFLRTGETAGAPAPFDSRIGKLLEGEMAEFLKEADSRDRTEPADGMRGGFSESEAVREAERCLRCDCRKSTACRLREYSGEYQCDQRRYWSVDRKKLVKRMPPADATSSPQVVYEPGKCIKCGICVRTTQLAKEPVGMAFTKRGFDAEVDVPFGQPVSVGLGASAAKCVESCPTGALAHKLNIEH